MARYRLDNYWHGKRIVLLTDSQARALASVSALALNDPTWPFANSGERRALSNALERLHGIMSKRVIG